MPRFERHEEYSGSIKRSLEEVFAYLDDQTHLTDHMSKPNWKMGWGWMTTRLDEGLGQAVGSHMQIQGRAFGIPISLNEAVTLREPPLRKSWETVGEPRLLVIGQYRMGYDLEPEKSSVRLRVSIDYDPPAKGLSRLLGLFFGKTYAIWCTLRMVVDAQKHFSSESDPVSALTGECE